MDNSDPMWCEYYLFETTLMFLQGTKRTIQNSRTKDLKEKPQETPPAIRSVHDKRTCIRSDCCEMRLLRLEVFEVLSNPRNRCFGWCGGAQVSPNNLNGWGVPRRPTMGRLVDPPVHTKSLEVTSVFSSNSQEPTGLWKERPGSSKNDCWHISKPKAKVSVF